MNKVLFLSIVAVSTAVVLFIPIIPIDETYTTTENYNRTLRYKVISAEVDERLTFGECDYWWEIVLQNIDVIGGTLTVTYKWKETWRPYTCERPGDCIWATRDESQYLESGETWTFRFEFNSEWLEPVVADQQYSISVPIVADTREVTRHRTHYRSIIDILTEWFQARVNR